MCFFWCRIILAPSGTRIPLDRPNMIWNTTKNNKDTASDHIESIRSWVPIVTTGWWFGTFFILPYIGNSNPNWLIFFRGVHEDFSANGTGTRLVDPPCLSTLGRCYSRGCQMPRCGWTLQSGERVGYALAVYHIYRSQFKGPVTMITMV